MTDALTIIPEHPTWHVLDATKLKSFQDCPRKMFWEYVAGWRPEGFAHDLEFGKCWHIGMEYLLKQLKANGHYSESDAEQATKLFLAEYRKSFPIETDAMFTPKDGYNAEVAYHQYIRTYAGDNFEVLHTEASGSIPIGVRADGSDKSIYFRLDAMVRSEDGVGPLEHKTTKSYAPSVYPAQWQLAIQPGGYLHVTYAIYGPDTCYLLINTAVFRKIPVKTGKGNEFVRIMVRKDPAAMQAWLSHVQQVYDAYYAELDKLSTQDPEAPTMTCFPMNPGHCTAYNRVCPYYDFCCSWHNPLQKLAVYKILSGFKREFWDPRELDTNETVKLEL
jgi:hypothetical protein